MRKFAGPIPAPAARKTLSAAPQPRRAGPQRGPLWHAIQLKAAQDAAAAPSATSRSTLPSALKTGVERLSGLAMDDVRVHRNSPAPARLGALAFAQGSDIHLGPGQERHLPHEAWHVVQQKQGRVLPNVQMKSGVALNDDPALEMEADRKGAEALAAAQRPAAGPGRTGEVPRPVAAPLVQRRAAGGDVVQAKLVRGGQEVKIAWYQWGSKVAHRYEDAPQTYILRDDSSVTSNVIHVLPADQKYLLGEQHGDGTWAARTALWSSMDTMHESGKAVPEAVPPGQGRGQALESLHAYAMQAAIAGQTMLHPINKVWTAVQANRVAQLIQASLIGLPGLLDQGRKWIVELLKVGDMYNAFAVANAARNGEAAVALVRTISADLEASWRAILVGMRDAIDDLKGRGNQALEPAAQGQYDIIHNGRPTLETLVTRLLPLMAVPAAANVVRIGELSQRAPAADPIPPDYLTAVNPHREAAMIANITAARAPLLVQIGNEHVDRVRAAVPGAVAVKRGVDFAAMSRKESG